MDSHDNVSDRQAAIREGLRLRGEVKRLEKKLGEVKVLNHKKKAGGSNKVLKAVENELETAKAELQQAELTVRNIEEDLYQANRAESNKDAGGDQNINKGGNDTHADTRDGDAGCDRDGDGHGELDEAGDHSGGSVPEGEPGKDAGGTGPGIKDNSDKGGSSVEKDGAESKKKQKLKGKAAPKPSGSSKRKTDDEDGGGDGDGEESAKMTDEEAERKRAKVLSHWQKWLEYSKVERAAKQLEGEKAVDKFLTQLKKGHKSPTLPAKIRSMIRNVQPFVPRAATTNRILARHCLSTTWNNHQCRHHQSKSKKPPVRDGETKGQRVGEYLVTGVPGARLIAKTESDESREDSPYLNCGCGEEEVLTEFFFWKTWTTTSPTTGVTESLKDQCFDPRMRVFVITAFNSMTKLKVDDLYANHVNNRAYQIRLLELQIARCGEELAKLKLLDEEDAERALQEEEKDLLDQYMDLDKE